MTDDQHATVLSAVQSASAAWAASFNAGDAAGCAAAYEDDAVMHARPFGSYKGRGEIEAFWRQLVADGFAEVTYLDPRIEVLDETSAVLSAGWRMNKAQGVITRELWVLQPDGSAKLREDDFEAQG